MANRAAPPRSKQPPADRLTYGQHVAYDAEHNTPLCNLFLTMLQRASLEIDAFGTSAGTLGEIGY